MAVEKKDTKNICAKILYEMKEGLFSACEKLPRETELSEVLGISRTQLRDSLAELEREGFITRRHGVGTVINRHVLQVKNRMDIEVEFMDMIRQSGYEPEITHVCVQEEPADAEAEEDILQERHRQIGIDGNTALDYKLQVITTLNNHQRTRLALAHIQTG